MTSEPTLTPLQPLPGDPFAKLEGPLAATTRMRLEVADNSPLTPGMQQVVFSAPELAGFSYLPGQDVMLLVDVDGGRPVRRRYTIRSLDTQARSLTLGIVRHSDGPGERWVRSAKPGDALEGIGPRGKIFPVADADWHLFVGDFAALPAYLTMAASLPPGTPSTVILEVPGPADEQPPDPREGATVIWRHQDGRPAGDPAALVEALTEVTLPPGRGHAYLAGEAKAVLALREVLAARGMDPAHMSPKAYWGRGRANASHGEPPKD